MALRRLALLLIITLCSVDAFAQAAAAQGPPGTGRAGAPAGGAPGAGRGALPAVQIGPSAPVPAEVAIPRPTAAEIEQVNAAFTRFVESDKSAAQPLFRKYQSLMLLQPPRDRVTS